MSTRRMGKAHGALLAAVVAMIKTQGRFLSLVPPGRDMFLRAVWDQFAGEMRVTGKTPSQEVLERLMDDMRPQGE